MAQECGRGLLRPQYNEHERIPAKGSGQKIGEQYLDKSWIEDVKYPSLGLFNDISCSGVLHHLKSLDYGLNVLR